MLSTLVSLALFFNKTAFNKGIKYALVCFYFKFESEVIDTPNNISRDSRQVYFYH